MNVNVLSTINPTNSYSFHGSSEHVYMSYMLYAVCDKHIHNTLNK